MIETGYFFRDIFMSNSNMLKFGFNGIYHKFYPGEMIMEDVEFDAGEILDKKYAFETGSYISMEQNLGSSWKLKYGLRYSTFSILGNGELYTFDDEGTAIDTSVYSGKEVVKTYYGFEPRFSANYIINPENSIKASYARNYQYLHLLSKSTAASPTDLWMPTSNNVKPQISDQISLGYYRNFKKNMYETSVEVYYKDLQNQIDYKNGADLNVNEMVESQLVYGKGRAYGVEFMAEKTSGRLTGWISYTLSKSERQFNDINKGDWFSAKQDRTHDFSIVGLYKLTNRWTISATWIYYTGDAVTFPNGKYNIEDFTINYYTQRNGYRMPAYHRLDLGATYTAKKSKKYESSWNFSLYNAYGRKNAYSIDFRQNETNPAQTEAVQLSLFSIVPSVTYNFKF